MSDRDTWEARYAARAGTPLRPPSALLVRCRDLLPPGRALDLACGDGRNALYLAAAGWKVDAIDRSHAALHCLLAHARAANVRVQAVQADLTQFPLPVARYAVVVNVRYLDRARLPAIATSLAPGGVLVFETFLREQARIGHPRNPAFLLEPGELAARFRDLHIELYEEGLCETEDEPAYLARLVARRPHAD